MDTRQLWNLSPDQFNEWRNKYDYPALFEMFKKKLPYFTDWIAHESLSEEIIFNHGFARFISSEEPLLLCTYKIDGKPKLFEKNFDRLPSIRKAGWISEEHLYQPYFHWLKKEHGQKLFEETKDNFRISSWIGGRPQFLNEHFLLDLGNCEITAPILSGRNLDFTCLDNLKITGAINNTNIYFWHCSAKGLKIFGGVAFLYFYRTHLFDSGYGSEKSVLTLSDGVFQDLHFKDCELWFHASRSKLHLCSINGDNLEGTLEHTDIESTKFSAGEPKNKNHSKRQNFYSKVKVLYSSIGKNAEAGDYYYKEKTNEMLALLYQKKAFWSEWSNNNFLGKISFSIGCYIKFFALFINFILWGFGEKPFRSLIASTSTISLSTLVYYFAPYSTTHNAIEKSIYFSIVTFATLGYGDISQKESFLQIYSSLEALLGMVLMGLFLAGYASKSKQY